ncbi:MAG: valine--tRNA ligase, partial [Bacteroidota bacterium]|nr:valine--tRNA ligase [Bacteroidota bacterium]
QMSLFVRPDESSYDAKFNPILFKMGNLSEIGLVDAEIKGAASFRVRASEFYIPLEGKIDFQEELNKLNEELEYTRGFLKSVLKKLSNERFVQNAPAQVVEVENKKKADAEAKIKVLEERIKSFK